MYERGRKVKWHNLLREEVLEQIKADSDSYEITKWFLYPKIIK